MQKKKPVLSISLLVSNRIDTIRRCLESIRPLLAAVPSELIVVDTVGENNSDGSLMIAKEYADRIVPFSWCNDFAAARNAGLECCTGEWFFYLDDDEWFESVDNMIDFFVSGEYLEYNSGTYQVRNYQDPEGSTYSLATVGRMIKRTPETRFVGRVHETFRDCYLPCKEFSEYVHHYGYAYKNEEERQARIQRNLSILREMVQQEPGNLHYRTQMAQELANIDNEAALAFCKETFLLCQEKESAKFQWLLLLVFRLFEALGTPVLEAERQYLEFKDRFGYNETTEHAICVQMTRICLLREENKKAHAYAERYFELDDFLKEHKETARQQNIADFAKYSSREMYLEMLNFGAFAAWQAKNYEAAWKRFLLMPWDEEGYENKEGLWRVLALYKEHREEESLRAILERCRKQETMKEVLEHQLPEFLWLSLPLEDFMQRAQELLSSEEELRKEAIWQTALDLVERKSRVKYLYLLYQMAESEIFFAVKERVSFCVGEVMETCISTGRAFYEALYQPECFTQEGMEWLPEDCRYNDILFRFLEGGQRELPLLLAAAKLRPDRVPVIKAWLQELAG